MPYRANSELPRNVRSHLPGGAQDIYRSAFNRAWDSYADDRLHEQIAHRIAWAAVKRRYRKTDGGWAKSTVNGNGRRG